MSPIRSTNRAARVLGVLVFSALAGPACESSSPDGVTKVVACELARDGDPCAPPGDFCGDPHGCGRAALCMDDGHWRVHVGLSEEEMTCPSDPFPKGSPCGDCPPFDCGPYTVETPCGTQTISVECDYELFVWRYSGSCEVDCRSLGDEGTCNAMPQCLWIVPCADSPISAPRCIGVTAGGCEECNECIDEEGCVGEEIEECVTLEVLMSDPSCPDGGHTISLCEPL